MSFLLEDNEDLLDAIERMNIINEFEADGETSEPEDEEEEFSMDDEGEETTPASDADGEEPAEDGEEEEYSMDDEEEYSMEDEGEEESQEGNEEEPEGDENTEDEEYEIPDEEGGDTEGDPEGGEDDEFSMDDESGETDSGTDNMDGDSMGSDEPNTKLKDLETVVFDNLSEPEKKLKIRELKELFIQIHGKCGTIADKVTELKTDEETIQIAEYISTTLIDLQKYIDDYINNIFDTKTYIENIAHLQKYITIFNAIGKVFAEINRENSK